jgi:putative FmdB family regulatory protein
MPKYAYCCSECKDSFEVWHSIKEEYKTCPECHRDTLERIPSLARLTSREQKEEQVGTVVKQFIEEAKREIDSDKEASREEYKT